MPICTPMGIRARAWDGVQLAMRDAAGEPNRNHQYSAFAGSLNALCTIVGWGTVFYCCAREGLAGNIVIRRSQIRYLRPVRTEAIVARGLPIEGPRGFFELLRSKGRSKIDVSTEIRDSRARWCRFMGRMSCRTRRRWTRWTQSRRPPN